MRQVDLTTIQTMAETAKGQVTALFAHWSAGHYGQFFDDYHICIDQDGSVHISTDDLTERKAHTWHHNTGAVGIALCCAYNATTEDLGPEPPTPQQVESIAQVIAYLCKELCINIDYDHVRTHAEQADLDGYGPATTCERWDLAILHNGDEWMSGGNIIRGKGNWYLAQMG